MSTVGALIDRTFRLILEPPDAQPASARLLSNVAIGDGTFSLTNFDVPEDENLVRLGSIIEAGSELWRVTAWDTTTMTGSMLRAQLGTTEAAHLADIYIKLSPPFARIDVFNAVRDNIIALYPDLWSVKTEVISQAGADAYPLADQLATEVVEINLPGGLGGGRTVNLDGRIVDNHPLVGGRAVVLNQQNVGVVWLRYRRRMDTATSEDDTLEELGVDAVWAELVMVSVAADLMAGRDVQASNVEWVQSTLQAENIRVGTRMSVAGGLAQYRDILMGRFMKEMRGEDSNRLKVHVNDPMAML